MARKFIGFGSVANFSYSDVLASIAGNKMTLAQTNSFATFYASLRALKDGDFGNGTLTGTLVNSATIASGKLNLKGAGTKHWTAGAGLNFPANLNIGKRKIKITPNYNGTPAADQFFWNEGFYAASGDRIYIAHLEDGNLAAYLQGDEGANVTLLAAAWAPVSGTEYTIELKYNITTGVQELLVNSVVVATGAATFVKTTAPEFMAIGRGWDGDVLASNFEARDLEISSSVTENLIYSSTIKPVVTFTPTITTALISAFVESSSKPTGTNIKYTMVIDGSSYYHNGTSWVVATTTEHANTAAEISSKLASLPLVSLGSVVYIKIIPQTTDTAKTPILYSVTITYTLLAAVVSPITECTVYCFFDQLIQDSGISARSAKLFAKPSVPFVHSGQLILDTELSVNFDANGYAEIGVTETFTVTKNVTFRVEFLDGTARRSISFTPCVVPNQESANLKDITTIAA